MNIILSHPTGNANVRAVAKGLFGAGMLTNFHTSIALFKGSTINKLGRLKPFEEIQRRRFDDDLDPFTQTWPWFELGRILSTKLRLKNLTKHEIGIFSTDNVFSNFDKQVASKLYNKAGKQINGVYAYEDAAFATFTAAKKKGIKCIYDLPIAYWKTSRKLMNEEAIRLPQWAITLGGGITDSAQKLENKTRELEMADMVIVPGKFVHDSLPLWAKDKNVVVSPFGTPEMSRLETIKHTADHKPNRRLRVLFAGSMGQRKGLGDLFEAVKMLDSIDVELVVMGSLLAPLDFYKNELSDVTYELGRPHAQVLELMRSCDVFCLPSIVEGRALVMQEAMSQGLPVIITANTGGEDLIIEGKTGFLVPIRSPEAIAEKLIWFLNNRNEIPKMGKLAQQHAADYTWANYAKNIIEAISCL